MRTDTAIRRHWTLVCCAFSFGWHHALRPTPEGDDAPVAASAAAQPPGPEAEDGAGGKKSDAEGIGRDAVVRAANLTWPRALRRVRARLTPWLFLERCWRAWSKAPPPPELQALVRSLGMGQPLNPYLRA